MAQRVLGLDIGRAAIKGVVIETSGRAYTVVGYHSEPIGVEPTADEEQLRAARQAALFHLMEQLGPVDQIMSALPGDMGAMSVVEMPFSDRSKLDETLPIELEDITPFPIDDLFFDYQFIEKTKGPSKLLVASVPIEQLSQYIDELQETNVDPKVLTVEGVPFFHLLDNAIETPHHHSWAILDIGYDQTALTIFQSRPDDAQTPTRIELTRTLSRGVRNLRQGLARTFNVDEDQADDMMLQYLDLDPFSQNQNPQVADAVRAAMNPLVMELRRTIAAAQRKLTEPLQQLYIVGGGALLRGIEGHLSQALHLEVQRLPLQPLETSEELEWPAASDTYVKALGLALQSLDHRNPYASINMRKGQFRPKSDLEFLKERLGSLMLMAAVLLVLLCASIFTSIYARSVQNDRMEEEVQKRCRQVIGRGGLTPRACLGIMEDEIQKASGKGGAALLPKTSSYDLLLVVYKRISDLSKGGRIKVEISSIRITPKRFDFEGETNSYGAVDKIEQRLKTYRCFRKIKKGKVQRSAGKSNKIEFRLSAMLSC